MAHGVVLAAFEQGVVGVGGVGEWVSGEVFEQAGFCGSWRGRGHSRQ